MDNKIKNMERLVYTAEDIRRLLCLSRSKAYAFLDEVYHSATPPFRVIKVGKLVRVPKEDFDNWIRGSTG